MNPHVSNRLTALMLAVATASLSLPVWALDIMEPLPEPGTMALLLGGVGAAVLVWRKNRKK